MTDERIKELVDSAMQIAVNAAADYLEKQGIDPKSVLDELTMAMKPLMWGAIAGILSTEAGKHPKIMASSFRARMMRVGVDAAMKVMQ